MLVHVNIIGISLLRQLDEIFYMDKPSIDNGVYMTIKIM